jgi:hypothetical protein
MCDGLALSGSHSLQCLEGILVNRHLRHNSRYQAYMFRRYQGCLGGSHSLQSLEHLTAMTAYQQGVAGVQVLVSAAATASSALNMSSSMDTCSNRNNQASDTA